MARPTWLAGRPLSSNTNTERAVTPCYFRELRDPSSSLAEKIRNASTADAISCRPLVWAILQYSGRRWFRLRNTSEIGRSTTPRWREATKTRSGLSAIWSWRPSPMCCAASCWCKSIVIVPMSCWRKWLWQRNLDTRYAPFIMRWKRTKWLTKLPPRM